jgi:hypothetical protein
VNGILPTGTISIYDSFRNQPQGERRLFPGNAAGHDRKHPAAPPDRPDSV